MGKSRPGSTEYLPPVRLVTRQSRHDKYAARLRGVIKVPHVTLHGIEHKSCFECGSLKPLTDYGKHAGKWDGLKGTCKDCEKKERTSK